jgi:hypothetical protein
MNVNKITLNTEEVSHFIEEGNFAKEYHVNA